jgi:hypothetical protein
MLAYAAGLALWRFLRNKTGRRRLLSYSTVAACVVLLLIFVNLKTSGCPLFPSAFGCISADWAVGRDHAALVGEDTRNFAKLGGLMGRQMPPLVLAAIAASFVGLRSHWTNLFIRHAVAISWMGILFLLATAPNPRFGIGYFLLPTAIAIVVFARWLLAKIPADISVGAANPRIVATGVLCLVLVISALKTANLAEIVYPKKMAGLNGDSIHVFNRRLNFWTKLSLVRERHGEVVVLLPTSSDQCWDASLPCTPEAITAPLRLLDEKQGLAGGFARCHAVDRKLQASSAQSRCR